MNLGLEGRVALVTGASVGIGRSIAGSLAAEGMRLVIVARRLELLEQLASDFRAAGYVEPAVIRSDLVAPGEVERVAAETLKAFDGRIDVLVNNAGGSRPIGVDGDDQIWRDVMELNFHMPRRLTHALLSAMIERRWGRVINISGTLEPQSLNAANSAKAALHAWSKGLSRAVGRHGITVNCVPPGRINSEQIANRIHPDAAEQQVFAATNIPVGRFGEPGELAPVVTFLASELSGYVNGELIHVDGGMRRYAF